MKRCIICKKELSEGTRIPICSYHRLKGKDNAAKGGGIVSALVAAVVAIVLYKDTLQDGVESVRDKFNDES